MKGKIKCANKRRIDKSGQFKIKKEKGENLEEEEKTEMNLTIRKK